MQTQFSALDYRIDLYFRDYKLAKEIDEDGHSERNIDCTFIRVDPGKEKFNIFKVIIEILRTSNNYLTN